MNLVVIAGCPTERLRWLERELERRGYGVERAEDHYEGLVLLDQQTCELLVVGDLSGGETSREFVARVRRGLDSERLPILLLTQDHEADYLSGYAAGATDCVPTSCARPELLAKCERLLGLRREAAPPAALPAPGARVLGRYDLRGFLGRGAYGAVYAAFDERRGRRVALKLQPHSCTPEDRERFLRESYTLAGVDSPHVVGVHDFGQRGGFLYLAMELVEGTTLTSALREQGPCSERQLRGLLLGLARGLVCLELRGIVHRDIKPANVVLRGGSFERPVLVDFGLAKRTLDRGVTAPGVLMGTAGYMAPELLDGPATHRSDLFSLGQVLVHAARGRGPAPQLDAIEVLQQMSCVRVQLPRWLSSGLYAVLRKLTAPRPGDRYERASQLLVDVEPLAPTKPRAARARPPLPCPTTERTTRCRTLPSSKTTPLRSS